MKKTSFLLIVAVLSVAGCRQAQTADSNSNVPSSSSANQQNSNLLVNSSTNIPDTPTQSSPTEQTVDPELLKQIEAQQLETADPRKASNKAVSNKPSGSSQRQTW